METVIKTYVSLFFTAVLTVLSVTVCSLSVQGKNANEYADTIATLWQESNYTLSEDDFKDELPKGYSLTLKKTGTTAGVLRLSYYFDAPLFGLTVPEDGAEGKGQREIVRTVR